MAKHQSQGLLQNEIYVYLIKESTQTFNKNDVNIQTEVVKKIVKEKINV
jgi:hypothetical protein